MQVGGQATPMTISESYDFSPYGVMMVCPVLFASDVMAIFDVFIMPAQWGEAKRLTYYSIK
jgi:tricorn protease-like protein